MSQNSDKSSSPSPEPKDLLIYSGSVKGLTIDQPKQELVLTWACVEMLISVLATALREVPDISTFSMVVVARGGLVPGAILAHQLGIRKIQVVNSTYYKDDNTRTESPEVTRPPGFTINSKTLIVDDIVDTGATFKALMDRSPTGIYCALIMKPSGDIEARRKAWYGMQVPDNVWVKFPWER